MKPEEKLKSEWEDKFFQEPMKDLALLFCFFLISALDQILLMTVVLDRLIWLGIIVIRFWN